MLSYEDNELLTRTGPGTTMGELFRSFWIPVLLSEQLPEREGPPVQTRVLSEDLLAFRDSDGRVGLIEPRCPHRGAGLFFGRNEEGGIRCSYHGWKFNVRGECLEMPTATPETYAKIAERARIVAYPVREWGGYVWAYMSRERPPPELPELEFAMVPPSHRYVSKKLQECNWAQAAEGAVDTAHFSFLHQPIADSEEELRRKAAGLKGFSKASYGYEILSCMRHDTRPQFQIREHEAGLLIGASRNLSDDKRYWRMAQYLLPSHGLSPSPAAGQTYHGQTWIPIDDESCWVYVYSWNPHRPLTDEERRDYANGGAAYPIMDSNWVPLRNRSNNYLLDRHIQKHEERLGILGVSEQDAAIQDSQGRIADRTRELLGPTDMGVVRFRRLMLDAARQLQRGEIPSAITHPACYRLRSGAIVSPASASFDEVVRMRFGNERGYAHGQTEPQSV